MKQKNAVRKGMIGLIVALVICLYFVIGAEVENRINMYTQQSFQYSLAAVVKVVYGFVGALLIRIGYGMAAGKKAKGKWRINITAVCALVGIVVFSLVAWFTDSLRSAVWNLTFIICAWSVCLFCVERK